jgi:hypothetical protein
MVGAKPLSAEATLESPAGRWPSIMDQKEPQHMDRLESLKSQAEAPHWVGPLAQQIAVLIRADLAANTRAMEELQKQLSDLVELQITYLEHLRSMQQERLL